MLKKSLRLVIPVCIVLSSCIKEKVDEMPPQPQEIAVDIWDSAPESEELVVEFSDEMVALIEEDLAGGIVMTKSSELNSVLCNAGIISIERYFPDAGEFEPRHREWGLHRFYKVTCDTPMTRSSVGRSFAGIPGVITAEPELKTRTEAVFNDPYYSYQWHYYNNGSRSSRHVAGADINVEYVWKNYTTGKSDVIVAVVDGGIDYNHPDLSPHYVGGKNFCSSQSGNAGVIAHRHGTHVAGTVSAVNNNGIGVCGVAGGNAEAGIRGVSLLSCQIFETNPAGGDFSASGADAITWGCDNGAVIAQNSWGYVYDTYAQAAAATIPSYLKKAVDYFIANAGIDKSTGQQVGPMAGGVVIFSAGNNNWDANPVGKYDPVITVGSIAPDFAKAYYSSYGDWVDIAAPGGDSYYSNGSVYSTFPGNSYGYMQGTSMACPHVSGVAALLVSYFGGPGFTNEMLKEKLLGGANPQPTAGLKIGPLVDVRGSFEYGGGTTPPDAVSSAEVAVSGISMTVSFAVTRDPDDIKAYGYTVLLGKDASLLAGTLDYSNLPAGIIAGEVSVGSGNVGDVLSATFSGLDYGTTYYVAVSGYDRAGNRSALSPVSSGKTVENKAPVIRPVFDVAPFSLHSYESRQISFSIEDPEGHAVTVSMVPEQPAVTLVDQNYGSYLVTVSGRNVEPGHYSTVLKATDSLGAASEYAIEYTIVNDPPAIVTAYDGKPFSLRAFESRNIKFIITDRDRHDFTVILDPAQPAATLENQGNGSYNLKVSGRNGEPGKYTTVLKATDIYGASDQRTIEYEILQNHAPEIVRTIPDMTISGKGESFSIDLDDIFTDPDGDNIKYSVSTSEGSAVSASLNGHVLDCETIAYGLSEVSVTASDIEHASAGLSFKIVVYDPASPEVSIYPNPVSDYLKIGVKEEMTLQIVLKSQTGKVVCRKTASVDPFSPMVVDMRSCVPGRYVLTVAGRNEQNVFNIMKL